MNNLSIYEEILSLERRLGELAGRITNHPGQQIILQAIRSAAGDAVSTRSQLTIPGSADPYMHTTLLDGTEQLTWRGCSLRPEQFRPGQVPAGTDDSVWIRMQEERKKRK